MKAQFGCVPGVISTRVGYTGGTTVNPTYRNIGDHAETVDIEFDPHRISYEDLLILFWKSHDPTTFYRTQYMSAIFYHDEEQRVVAEKTKREHQKDKVRPIVTKILLAGPFYEAEDYHQKYKLRQHPELLQKLALDDRQLIKSKVAAKLNGYMGDSGTLEDFEKDKQELDLKLDVVKYVENQLRKKYRG
ncbi:hypothetical protein ACJMK2_010667 [Sinanodonta woodiana]|uniref:peptide-methionine (S)-S-oxide reductase n=1 Tax=Sinanodonta woodiana TaxID=1069815 RepID=A0ABD3VHC8_SINWO